MFKIIYKMNIFPNKLQDSSLQKRLARHGQALLQATTAIAFLGGALLEPGAKALTVTYNSNKAAYLPSPNALTNTRPLQLSLTGTAINNFRNFIYTGLAPSPLAGSWIPLNQAGPNLSLIHI